MRTATAAVLACAILPAPALAQAYQCRVPDAVEMPRPVRPDGPAIRKPVGGYLLAISWSPEYCKGKAGAANDYQCGGRIGRFGFVLHGLWPEAARGAAPQWCALEPRPSAEDIKANLCMTPVPWLLEHEWAKHGSCMARNPTAYFKASAVLWNSLTMPDADKLSRKAGLTTGDLRKAVVAANPFLNESQVGVLVSNGGWLREMRVCYGKDFMPRACDRRAFGPKNAVPLKIWRGL